MSRSISLVLAFAALTALTLSACADDDPAGGGEPDARTFPDAAPLPDAPPPPDATPPPSPDAAIALACTSEEITPLAQCAAENCASGGGGDIQTCLLTNCTLLLLGLSSDCQACLASAASQDFTLIAATCIDGPTLPQ